VNLNPTISSSTAGLLPLLLRSRRQVLAIWVIAMLVSGLFYFYSYNSNLDGIAGGGSNVKVEVPT